MDPVRKRLIWAIKGCLWAGILRRNTGLEHITLLHDFNGMKFESLVAPYAGGRPITHDDKSLTPAKTTPPRRHPPRPPLRPKPDRSKIRPEQETDD